MLKQLKPQPADASRTPSRDGALLPTYQCCQLSSWHLGTFYIETGKCHTLSLAGQLCQRGSLPFHPASQPFPASQGSSDLTASQLILKKGIIPLSPACSRPWRIGLWFPLQLQEQHKAKEFGFHPLQIYPRSGVGPKQHIDVRGNLCVPQNMAFSTGFSRLWRNSLELHPRQTEWKGPKLCLASG